jgi:hypothetical protein
MIRDNNIGKKFMKLKNHSEKALNVNTNTFSRAKI